MSEQKDKPLVSIIIPSYNYSMYIGQCIDSCLAQTYDNVEIVVVDDCSTDGSVPVIVKHLKRYKDQFIRCPENKGYSHAKNLGIRLSRGEYICHLDSDDFLTPDSVEVRMKAFEEDPSLDMVSAWAWKWRLIDGKWRKDSYNKNSKIHAQTVILKKQVFRDYGLYYEQLRSKSDKEYWMRLGVHPKSSLKQKINYKKLDEFVSYYRKHDPEIQMHKRRRLHPEIGRPIEKIFKQRMNQLRREGITRENTLFLEDK